MRIMISMLLILAAVNVGSVVTAGEKLKAKKVFETSPKVAAAPIPPAHWHEGYVYTNGIRIHYWRTGGKKPVLVLANGFSDNGLCWAPVAMDLEKDYDIIMFDARGHGRSDPPNDNDLAEAQAEDLAGLIRELKLDKPIVMGHSMGSSSTAWFAAKYPDVPRAVILEDPRLAGKPWPDRSPEKLAKHRSRILDGNNHTYAQYFARALKHNTAWSRLENQYWAVSKMEHHPLSSRIKRGKRPPMKDLFQKITAPTLILKADDQGELRKDNEAVAEILKNGTLVHVQEAHHNVRRDQKERFMTALLTFLKKLD